MLTHRGTAVKSLLFTTFLSNYIFDTTGVDLLDASISGDGWVGSSKTISCQKRGGATATLPLIARNSISGQVVQLDTKEPVPAYTIKLDAESKEGAVHGFRYQIHDIKEAAGLFRLLALSSQYQRFRIHVFSDGYKPYKSNWYPIAEDQHLSGISISLLKAAPITGSVLSNAGVPILGAEVALLPSSELNEFRMVFPDYQRFSLMRLARSSKFSSAAGAAAPFTTTNQSGEFSFKQTPSFPYTLLIFKHGHAVRLQPFPPNVPQEEIICWLEKSGSVVGQVQQGDEHDATRKFFVSLKSHDFPIDYETSVDANANFRQANLLPGNYSIQLSTHSVRGSHAHQSTSKMTIASEFIEVHAEGQQRHDFFLGRAAAGTFIDGVVGNIPTSLFAAPCSSWVSAYAMDDIQNAIMRAPLDKNGRFQIGGLPQNQPFMLVATIMNQSWSSMFATTFSVQPSKLAAGDTLTIAAPLPSIQGQVTLGGKPHPNTWVTVLAETGDTWENYFQSGSIKTNEEGLFSIFALPPGKYSLVPEEGSQTIFCNVSSDSETVTVKIRL
ncbi:MAG: carboxypeptidase regulatory-like domain-containing protein [Planctomycetes bacterium]|nr:carboxypeptidase regulatory-like domain-containing protein [Planctomycetota bacterium]MBT4027962.1 carboxypeptidase regulatory-like domain-containing protein [Planctomycetota bacterium]MBT4560805.1 carboxypeptidase regulatory-like domain-containing protein [Planctomycetota bacterium]MBT5100719.1 carboxypeptidase regulatory-like domain-containing protein [Planctomycetota bacterium]MBT7319634.1 carboxypeptidase regulatory-like domain-containing protein [Planctomycetota bacterium]